MKKRIGLRFIGWASLSLVVAFSVLVLAFADLPQIRYTEDKCLGELIWGQTGDIDIVSIGSSSARSGFSSDFLEDELFQRTGKHLIIYNMARAWRDSGHNYVVIKDLLERRKVKMLLVEYNSTEDPYHVYYPRKSKLADLFENFSVDSNDNFIIKLHTVVSWIFDRSSLRLSEAMRNLKYKQPLYTNYKIKPAITSTCDSITNREAYRVNNLYTTNPKKKSNEKWDIHSIFEARNKYYNQKIIDLAQSHGTKIIFTTYTKLYHGLVDPKVIDEFEKTFNSEYIYPNEQKHDEFFKKENYLDSSHMNMVGQKQRMKWLADEISKKI